MRYIQIIFFFLRQYTVLGVARRLALKFLGLKIGRGTNLPRSVEITWPHRVNIGSQCILKSNISLHVDGPWAMGDAIQIGDRVFLGRSVEFNVTQMVVIGDDTLVGSGAKFIDHDHGKAPNMPMRNQLAPAAPIIIGADCWIGSGSIILKGVRIGDGAIVGARSLVNSDVPEREIWAGAPARRIGIR